MNIQELEVYLPEYKGDKFGDSWAEIAYEALHCLSLGDSFKNLSPFKQCLLLLLQERVRKTQPDFVVKLERVSK